MTGMTPEQEIRAVAIQAAGAFCAPFSHVQNGVIPNPEDVLFVADVFYGYIQDGATEALRINATSDKSDQPSIQSVQLREQAMQLASGSTASAPPAIPKQPVAPKRPDASTPPVAPEPPAKPRREDPANVIPMADRGTGSKKQEGFLNIVEKTRRGRAEALLKESAVAKTAQHKRKLIDQAHDAGVGDFVLDVGSGEMQQLGTYLASL